MPGAARHREDSFRKTGAHQAPTSCGRHELAPRGRSLEDLFAADKGRNGNHHGEIADRALEIAGEIEEYEYGKFAWIIDPEGNKLELWEPIDSVFTDLYEGKTTH